VDLREQTGWALLEKLRKEKTPTYPADFVRQWGGISKVHFNRTYPELYSAVAEYGRETAPQRMGGGVHTKRNQKNGRENGKRSEKKETQLQATIERQSAEIAALHAHVANLERCIEALLMVAADHDRNELLREMEKRLVQIGVSPSPPPLPLYVT
jgi:hypothetical protein